MPRQPIRVLIPFNTVSLYGMERAVIETFDLLRPEVEPHFLLSHTTLRSKLPVLTEIQHRGLKHSFFSDRTGWPRIGRPRSLDQSWRMMLAMLRGNRDVFIAARNQDLIYLPSFSYFYFTVLGAVLHRLRKKRIVYQFHDLITRRSFRLRLTTMFVTDFIHTTQFGHEQVAKENSYVESKSNWVIPLTVCVPSSVAGTEHQRAAFEEKWNLLFVGQIAKHKGVEVLLEAFEQLRKTRSDVTLHLIGGCGDQTLVRKLSDDSLSGDARIRQWGYREDVSEFLSGADILIHPSPSSTNESYGRVVLEAMSFGVPSVCFGSGALKTIVAHEQTGLVCEEESAECLARNIEKLLSDSALRLRCSAAAKKAYKELCSPRELRQRWLEVFQHRCAHD